MLPHTLSIYFQEQHPRHSQVITGGIANLFSLRNTLCDSIHGFVGVILWIRGTPPSEESDKVAANLKILCAGGVSIFVEAGKQFIKCILRQNPFASRC